MPSPVPKSYQPIRGVPWIAILHNFVSTRKTVLVYRDVFLFLFSRKLRALYGMFTLRVDYIIQMRPQKNAGALSDTQIVCTRASHILS